MADTDVFNVVKWQTHFQKKGEKKAGQCVWEIRKVFVRVEWNCLEAVV